MAKLSPTQKQALSGLAVTVLGAVLTWANMQLHLLPLVWQGVAGAVLAGVAHVLPALGTADKVEAKVSERVAEVIEKESVR